MSNTKKIKAKKVNNTPKRSTLGTIWGGTKYFMSSWLKNDTCVDARTKKWYWAVLIAIVSLIIAVIPTMVNSFKVKGASFLEGVTYNIDSQLNAFTNDLKAKDINLKIENGTISDVSEATKTWAEQYGECYKHVVTIDVAYANNETGMIVETKEKYVDFAAYYFPEAVYAKENKKDTTKTLSECMTEVMNGKNPIADGETVGETYTINALFIGKDSFSVVKYRGIDAKSAQVSRTSLTCKFDGKNAAGETSYLLTSLIGADKAETIENWKVFLTNSYNSIKIATGWSSTGITFGIYTALTILFGFVVWIMTRGKNNPFRIYKFWECQKIAYWAALAPAVLGMILGFFMSNMVMLGFILFFGVRIMWMSMRSLKPYQDNQK